MSAEAELVSMVNDIRLDYDRGRGTLGEVRDRVLEIARRILSEELLAEVAKLDELDLNTAPFKDGIRWAAAHLISEEAQQAVELKEDAFSTADCRRPEWHDGPCGPLRPEDTLPNGDPV